MSQFCNYYFAPKNTPPGFLLVMSDSPGFCNAYQRSISGYKFDPRFVKCCGEEAVMRVGGCLEWCAMADHYKPVNQTCIRGQHPEEQFAHCLGENATTARERGATQAVSCFMPHYKSGAESVPVSSPYPPAGVLGAAALAAVLIAARR